MWSFVGTGVLGVAKQLDIGTLRVLLMTRIPIQLFPFIPSTVP
jgi:hypothetical protein